MVPLGRPVESCGIARSAIVTGAPSTSRIGTSIDNSMCATMCTLNIAGMYRPSPEDVVISSVAQPSSHATVRPAGHASPRRRLGEHQTAVLGAEQVGLATAAPAR